MGMRNSPLHIHNNFQNPPEINSYSALPINFASLRTGMSLIYIYNYRKAVKAVLVLRVWRLDAEVTCKL